ncbi:MAG TPA: hypothetical protein VGP94_01740 [Tepidisphaeraceae bacterium]|nr:hypothetical protein [Tepidisphaeraceae bacterium]
MVRWMFRIVCIVSMLVCIAVLTYSLFTPDGHQLRFHTADYRYELHNWRRSAGTAVSLEIMGGKLWPDGAFRAPPGKRWDSSWQRTNELPLGIVVDRSPANNPAAATYFRILVPIWLLVVVSGVLPAIWLWRVVRRMRKRGPGFCVSCGYDLRAS